ncbi:MAG: hypothetical protein BWY59_01173 [Verrucomicrobia bacterium ADurb.Bin345]|nr:MAG: hypothetical protein BWY59_01173 [Verrucomicrobia bacterium ADurb.Bin345]
MDRGVHCRMTPDTWSTCDQLVPSVVTKISLRSHVVPVSSVSYQLWNDSVALAAGRRSIHGETSSPALRLPVL